MRIGDVADILVFRKDWKTKSGRKLSYEERFNNPDDVFKEAQKSAYSSSVLISLNFNGLDSKTKKELKNNSFIYLTKRLSDLFSIKELNQSKYNSWAIETITHIRSIYKNSGIEDYTYGKAQKLVIIALKYVFSSSCIDYKNVLFKYCDLPIDRIIQVKLYKNFNVEPLACAWSKCDNLGEMMNYQERTRYAILKSDKYSSLV